MSRRLFHLPKLVHRANIQAPICVTSFDVIQDSEGNFSWGSGERLQLDEKPNIYLIGASRTNKLDHPLVAYAAIMKQIIVRSKLADSQVVVGVATKHKCLGSVLGERLAKDVRLYATDVHFKYTADGLKSLTVVLGNAVSLMLEFSSKPTVKEFRKAIADLTTPQYSSFIYRYEMTNAEWLVCKKYIESVVKDVTVYSSCYCLVLVGRYEIHTIVRQRLGINPTPLGMSKPDRYARIDKWMAKSDCKWSFLACVIREFCYIALHYGITVDAVRRIVHYYPSSVLYSDWSISGAILSAFYCIEKTKRMRHQTINKISHR